MPEKWTAGKRNLTLLAPRFHIQDSDRFSDMTLAIPLPNPYSIAHHTRMTIPRGSSRMAAL